MKCIECGGDKFHFRDWQDERDNVNAVCNNCRLVYQPPELPIDFVDADELPEFDRECKAIIYFKYNSSKLNAENEIISHFESLENDGLVCVMDMELK